MIEAAWSALLVTCRVAPLATLLAFGPAVVLAYWFSRREFRGKALLSALSNLPLFLPPTAIGYLLLLLLSDSGPLAALERGLTLLFTWKAAVLASATMAFPLMVRSARLAFDAVDPRLERVARTLGYGPVAVFLRFTVPMAARGLMASLLLGLLRAVGEFGATVMVAGNIPGRTQTLPLGLFSAEQAGRDDEALLLLGIAIVCGVVASWAVERLTFRPSGDAATPRPDPSRGEAGP